MKTTCATTAALLALMLIGAALDAQQTTAPAETSSGAAAETSPQHSPAFADSKVRIVRLSQVKGAVQLDRNTGHGFESAMPNLPITEGARLQTDSGFAEVEFEDNSTVRIAPDSLIEFPQLELRLSGAKASTVNVLKGTVYVSLANTKGNEFTLTFAGKKLTPMPSSHIRLQLEPAQAKLAVFDGNVQVEQAAGATEVGKKKTLAFDLTKQSQPSLVKNVAEDQNDAWDQDAVEYHKRYANSSAFAGSPYAYGISDMNYYGSFLNAGGCGSMWRPYFASAAWDPFSNGVWAWYPGAGYSWVSPYPWGWMPYHYGDWSFCPGMGWGWRPGGSWVGLANAGSAGNPILRPHRPIQPIRQPIRGQSTLVPVNSKPIAVSTLKSRDTFVFRNDSAGLGIPRGSLGKLNKFSSGAERHGFVAAPVYSAPIQAGRTTGAEPSRWPAQGSAGRTTAGSGNYPRSSPSGMPSYSGAREHQSGGGVASRPAGTASSGASRAGRSR